MIGLQNRHPFPIRIGLPAPVTTVGEHKQPSRGEDKPVCKKRRGFYGLRTQAGASGWPGVAAATGAGAFKVGEAAIILTVQTSSSTKPGTKFLDS